MRFTDFEGCPNNSANHQAVTIGNTVQTLAVAGATIHAQTKLVRITAELADIRFVHHGTTDPDPATNLGEVLYDGDSAVLSRAQFDCFKFKRNAGTNAKLQIAQYLS